MIHWPKDAFNSPVGFFLTCHCPVPTDLILESHDVKRVDRDSIWHMIPNFKQTVDKSVCLVRSKRNLSADSVLDDLDYADRPYIVILGDTMLTHFSDSVLEKDEVKKLENTFFGWGHNGGGIEAFDYYTGQRLGVFRDMPLLDKYVKAHGYTRMWQYPSGPFVDIYTGETYEQRDFLQISYRY